MDTVKVSSGYGTYYYIDSSSSSDRLTRDQMTANVLTITNICKNLYPDWTDQAIAAMCGNFQSEGILNPSQWEYGYGKSTEHGYGLAQWTPASKILDWFTENNYSRTNILYQIKRIEYERDNGLQYYKTDAYNFSFTEFLTGSYDVSTLAKAWLYNYERPKNPEATESIRVSQAIQWLLVIAGQQPIPPGGETPDGGEIYKIHRMPLWMYRR